VAQVVVTAQGELRTEVWAGRHTLTVGEPVELGGTDDGPNPYELLLAALGACTAMTLTLYARRKGLPLEGVEIRLTHSRIHEKDCEECEKGAYLDHVDKEIVVAGALTPEQVQRLGEIAEMCPVNRTLHQGIRTSVVVRLAGEP